MTPSEIMLWIQVVRAVIEVLERLFPGDKKKQDEVLAKIADGIGKVHT